MLDACLRLFRQMQKDLLLPFFKIKFKFFCGDDRIILFIISQNNK